jgi:hypothetical protein
MDVCTIYNLYNWENREVILTSFCLRNVINGFDYHKINLIIN